MSSGPSNAYEVWCGEEGDTPRLSTETDEHVEILAREEAEKAEYEEEAL